MVVCIKGRQLRISSAWLSSLALQHMSTMDLDEYGDMFHKLLRRIWLHWHRVRSTAAYVLAVFVLLESFRITKLLENSVIIGLRLLECSVVRNLLILEEGFVRVLGTTFCQSF